MKLILDCPYICHKVRYGMRGIELTEDDLHVEVVFGFLKQLLMICKRFQNADDYIFCWDSKHSFRKRIYPQYKANRIDKDKNEEDKKFDSITMTQFQVLRRHVLPNMGFINNFFQHGIESDDIMASIVINNPEHEYMLVTSDRDLFQLLGYNLKIYSLHTRNITDLNKFVHIYGIPPEKWVEAKSIGGCATDNIHGIYGVSDPAKSNKSLAIAYIQGNLTKGKVYNRIKSKEGQEIIERNKMLIGLPFFKTRKFELKKKSLWRKDFRDIFEKFNFQSLLRENEFRVWENIMNLN